jgi:hypothetical protein
LESGNYSDFKIICESGGKTREWAVHKAIIRNTSSYFRGVVKETFKEGHENEATLQEIQTS